MSVASTAEAVLDVVGLIPPGRALTYGDVALLVGTSPRRVGTIMAQIGSEVAWWRVTNARGALPDHLAAQARRRWAEEGIPTTADGARCAVAACRADLAAIAEAIDASPDPQGDPHRECDPGALERR